MENAKCYAPQILVGTEGLPREQWLEYRRKGIGGSDAAAVLGISPFRTGRDLYYDKLNIVTADDAENWVQMEVGTLLEPLVAKIFAHKTGYKIYRRPFMFRHPQYPWMLADLDYMVELSDGTSAILEIKTTNYNAKDNWWYNGEEIVPIYYESQGRHYMAVMNIDRVYFCCLYGNSEDEAIIRRIDRDMAYEEELIALERDFWENHVLTKTPPPYVEADGDLILESLRRKLGPADKDAPPVLLGQTQFGQLSMLLSLQEQKKALSADVSKLDKDIKRLKGMLTMPVSRRLNRWVSYQSTIRPRCVRTNRDESVQTNGRLSCKIMLRRMHTTTHGGRSRRLHFKPKTVYQSVLEPPFQAQISGVLSPYTKDCFNTC